MSKVGGKRAGKNRRTIGTGSWGGGEKEEEGSKRRLQGRSGVVQEVWGKGARLE